MDKLLDGVSVTIDKSQFLLGGRPFNISYFFTTRRCSVNELELTELDDKVSFSFTWKNFLQSYKIGVIPYKTPMYTTSVPNICPTDIALSHKKHYG